jgi:uncharacterized NAD-dependent epimerase/dehydratase family protein
MKKDTNNNAIVYCEGGFNTTNGKTAHGLVRFTERFRIIAVIDSKYQGRDSGLILDGNPNGIPVVKDLNDGLIHATGIGISISGFIIGLAPDGGRLPEHALVAVRSALKARLDVYSGLHDYLSDNEELATLADRYNCSLTDIRKPPEVGKLHFFSGKIEQVKCLKIALLGTDSAVGKRTTAWKLVHGLRKSGYRAEMIGTGQTAWLQGARYSIILDSLINDFVSGEIEHAVYEAWQAESPDVIILEGQGSLLNPAYPGGFELLAAGRPDLVILQHAPRRREYDGFPGYNIHPLNHQVLAIEVISGRKVYAITLNHEGMEKSEIEDECRKIRKETGIEAFDVLEHGADDLVKLIQPLIKKWEPREIRRSSFSKA